ncbi:hypothetical protein AVEN_110957-1 [Araneus ventricosus]|uniref:Uncharacterized protein n=1 Tax=Araneus ventricosus TaxID=182803 RepID=A0A4Y2HDA3_ARAVE|nr:hypothetical protein AVEN_110957-1 [Araneus ventricosus]
MFCSYGDKLRCPLDGIKDEMDHAAHLAVARFPGSHTAMTKLHAQRCGVDRPNHLLGLHFSIGLLSESTEMIRSQGVHVHIGGFHCSSSLR